MNNIIKNFYCDFVLLRLDCLSPVEKLSFLFDKYLFFINKLRQNYETKLLGTEYNSGDNMGLLNIEVMLKDFYLYYYIECPKKPVIVDVGACVGTFTLASNIFYSDAKIYSIEPVEETYRILNSNTKNYRNISTFNLGIGNRNETKAIYFANEEKDRSSFYRNNILNKESIKTEIVNIVTLDTFLLAQKITRVDILKIDVEGFEKEVIDGLNNLIKTVRHLIVEIHLEKNQSNFAYITNYLSQNGFALIKFGKIWIDKNGVIKTLDVIYKKI